MQSILRTVERVYDRIVWSPYSEVRDCIENKKPLPADIATKYDFLDIVGVFPQAKNINVWQPSTPAVLARCGCYKNLTLMLLQDTPNQTNTSWFDLQLPVPEEYTGIWSRVVNGGKTVEITCYSNGIEHGFSKTYEDGKLVMSCSYVFGHYDDRYEQWYPNGRPKILAFYKHGKLNGKYRSWYPNLKSHESCFYKDGKRMGIYIRRYENGNPQMICKFNADFISGECMKYDEQGSITYVCSFADNETETEI